MTDTSLGSHERIQYTKNKVRHGAKYYEELVLASIRFSDLWGGIATTRRGIESTKIYTRITLSAMTINALLPGIR
jgi:hypothetical protein